MLVSSWLLDKLSSRTHAVHMHIRRANSQHGRASEQAKHHETKHLDCLLSLGVEERLHNVEEAGQSCISFAVLQPLKQPFAMRQKLMTAALSAARAET